MMNIIAIDVASEVSSVCILGANKRIRMEDQVPTRITELKRLIKTVPRPRQVVFEEGTQAAWLWSELSPICDDILVCNPSESAKLSGQFKSDKNDARNLAQHASSGLLKRVWHGGKELQNLRESVRTYQSVTEQCVRLKNQLKAVFRSRGIAVGNKAYTIKTRQKEVQKLTLKVQRERVLSLGELLDLVLVQRATALKNMVQYARKHEMYKPLRTVDGVGPVFASMLTGEIGDPNRFRTRVPFWSYSGLAIMTYSSSEFELKDGCIARKPRRTQTRGLVRQYNRTLKYVFKQAAMTLSRTKWKAQYQTLLEHSKNKNNVQLTLARKLASIVLHIAKTGETYDIAKAFKAQ